MGVPGRDRPKLVLACWAVAIVVLAVLGIGVEDRLKQTTLYVPGTDYARASDLAEREFGIEGPIAVLLRGPPRELDRQGPRVVRALERNPKARALSPWDRGPAARVLRPRPDAAMISLNYEIGRSLDFEWIPGHVKGIVERETSPPVTTHYTGITVFGSGLKKTSLDAATQAERIAAPLLIVILLLVFRSPVAAAIPLVFGGAAVIAGRGVISLLAGFVDLDPAVINLASMMGLALGVDYALLVVSRFREELKEGRSPSEAALVAGDTAGRTILFAGVALLVAMVLVLLISPGTLLFSLGMGVVIGGTLSVLIGISAIPAALSLVGTRIDKWRIGRRSERDSRWLALAGGVMRRPLAAALAVLGLMLLMAAPVAAIETGPPDVRQLPEGQEEREDFEVVRDTLGPGWAATFEVVAAREEGPITDRRTLAELARWQRRIARLPGVEAVIGPAPIARQAQELRGVSSRLDRTRSDLAEGRRGLRELRTGLDRAARGVEGLRAGLGAAAAGSEELGQGAGVGAEGSSRLAAGLAAARDGSAALADGLATAAGGAARLRSGAVDARSGAARLAGGLATARRAVENEAGPGARLLADGLERGSADLSQLREPAGIAERELDQALRELEGMTVGKTDPRYLGAYEAVARASGAVSGRNPLTGAPVSPGYDGLDEELASGAAQLSEAAAGATRLAEGSDRLAAGLRELESGAGELASGVSQLARGNAELSSGLRRLTRGGGALEGGLGDLADGAGELAGGLVRLRGGADELGTGLSEGERESAPLVAGLRRAGPPLAEFETQLSSSGGDLDRLRTRSPGLFDSGNFVLAALDGSPEPQRKQAASAISFERGGQGARIVVVPEAGPNDPGTHTLGDRLHREVEDLERRADVDAAVGGIAEELTTYDDETKRRFPWLIAALAISTWLVLVVIFRAIVLPLIAVVLNLLTVAAAFGILTAISQAPGNPLGGVDYLDAVSATGICTVMFGLSIDYEVFLIARMREGWLKEGDTEKAIEYGLSRTASVVTGAALIMTGVFFAFATTDLANLRQFGVGMVIAVLLDATIIRLILLPALMRLAGRWNWWLPSWLDRRLPDLQIEAPAPAPARA